MYNVRSASVLRRRHPAGAVAEGRRGTTRPERHTTRQIREARDLKKSSITIAWVLLAAGVVVATALFARHGNESGLPRGTAPQVRATVGLFAPDPSRTIDADYSKLAERLGREFDVLQIGMGSLADLDTLDVLLVVGSGHLPDARLYEIDQFVMRGGRAAFLLNGASISEDENKASVVRGNLFAFVEAYGATANPDLVVDVQASSSEYKRAQGPYAFWPIGSSQDNRLARRIMPRGGDAVFAWTSSLLIHDRVGGIATVLARSGPDAWTTMAVTSVAPDFAPEPDRAALLEGSPPRGSYPLAVVLDGKIKSAFSDLPVIVEHDDGTVEFTDPSDRINESPPTRMAILGSSRMFDDEVVAAVPANLDLITNLVAWLGDRRDEH